MVVLNKGKSNPIEILKDSQSKDCKGGRKFDGGKLQ